MLPEEAGEEWRSWTHQTQLRHGPSEGTGCTQPLSKEAAPACSICSLTVSPKPCRCPGTCFVLMVSEGNAALVSTYTCTLLHCTGLCQRSAPTVSACSFSSWGSFQLPLEQNSSLLIGGLAVSWLLLAPFLTLFQGISLCLAQTWCSVLFSPTLLSLCVRSSSWVTP